jgi:hypothetical protein
VFVCANGSLFFFYSFVVSASGGHRLITTVIKTLKWPLLAPVLPRVALVAFTVCQPLLTRRVILYLDETRNNDITNIGYGLIGAYMFVYSGIAVSYEKVLPRVCTFTNFAGFDGLVLLSRVAFRRHESSMLGISYL